MQPKSRRVDAFEMELQTYQISDSRLSHLNWHFPSNIKLRPLRDPEDDDFLVNHKVRGENLSSGTTRSDSGEEMEASKHCPVKFNLSMLQLANIYADRQKLR